MNRLWLGLILTLVVGCVPVSPSPKPTAVTVVTLPPVPTASPVLTPTPTPTPFPAWEGYATPEAIVSPVRITIPARPVSPSPQFAINAPQGKVAIWRVPGEALVAFPWGECKIHPPTGWEITDLGANLGERGVWVVRCLQEVNGYGDRIERSFVPLDSCPTAWEILGNGYAKPGILPDGGVLAYIKHKGLRSYYVTLPAVSLGAGPNAEYYIRCAPDASCIIAKRGGGDAWVVRRVRNGWEIRSTTVPALIETWWVECNEVACTFSFSGGTQ